MADLFISTTTFDLNKNLQKILDHNNISYKLNPFNRKLTPLETLKFGNDCKYLIAGTESLDEIVRENNNLKFICRLGTGIENVPAKQIRRRKISLAITPFGLAETVSELVVGHILNLIRNIQFHDLQTKKGIWKKEVSNSIYDATVGVIGSGNIGIEVIKKIKTFYPKKIYIYDKKKNDDLLKKKSLINYVNLNKLLKESDIITLHLPYNTKTKNIISSNQLNLMKDNTILINTSRGGLVNEKDLYRHMKSRFEFKAAFDTFVEEPYKGNLLKLKNFIATPHIASQTRICRSLMEKSAINEVINFKNNKKLNNEIKL